MDEGEIVAARYSNETSYYRWPLDLDSSWKKPFYLNRARVVSFREDSYDTSRLAIFILNNCFLPLIISSTVDLDFVDFGDAEEKSIGEVPTSIH